MLLLVTLAIASPSSAQTNDDLRQDTGLTFTGKIIDAVTKRPVIARLEFDLQPSNIRVAVDSSDANGAFFIELPYLAKYDLKITADDHFPVTEIIGLSRFAQHKTITRNFALDPLHAGSAITLQGINFETGSAKLTENSGSALSAIRQLLIENPRMTVEISGHTDNIGDAEANRVLSLERARAVVQYFVDRGIAANRLNAKGNGEAMPITTNKTEKGREANRRVEFLVIDR